MAQESRNLQVTCFCFYVCMHLCYPPPPPNQMTGVYTMVPTRGSRHNSEQAEASAG